MAHICVGKLTIIGSDDGVSPGRRQAIIWNNFRTLLIRNSGTNFSEILSDIQTLPFTKIYLKMSSRKWRPFCHGLNGLILFNESHIAYKWLLSKWLWLLTVYRYFTLVTFYINQTSRSVYDTGVEGSQLHHFNIKLLQLLCVKNASDNINIDLEME